MRRGSLTAPEAVSVHTTRGLHIGLGNRCSVVRAHQPDKEAQRGAHPPARIRGVHAQRVLRRDAYSVGRV